MNIIFNKNTPQEEVYTEEQIKAMNKAELKSLKSKCQATMADISLKRSRYINDNNEERNSHAFYKKLNGYKTIIGIYQRAIFYLNDIENKKEPTPECKDREHWLWCYYQESLKMLAPETVDMIKELADERAEFHIEFEKIDRR